MRKMAEKKKHRKVTETEGYFTGNGDCTLIAPMRSPIGSGNDDEWNAWRDISWEEKIKFYDIMPKEMRGLDAPLRDKKCKFRIEVSAEEVEENE